MIVNVATEKYLISLGLTKKQIQDMLPSEVEEYCKEVIKKQNEEFTKNPK
jgi:hypothetical protein